jgi:putative FmdB family regulatory protein
MPIYEFYCLECHMLFNFFSATVDTASSPACPRCGRSPLARRPARFATLSRTVDGQQDDELGGEDPLAGLDEERLERAMEAMAGELDRMGDEEDPRQMARFFRTFGDAAGMKLGPRMEEMLQRLEAGEDPDSLEEELGGVEGEASEDMDEWFQLKEKARSLRSRRPRVDEKLYFL